MSKKLLGAALAIVFVIGASMAYVLLQNGAKTGPGKIVTENTNIQGSPQPDLAGEAKGRYTNYTEEDFTSTRGVRLLFFHASWCPQCRALDESIKSSELPAGVTIFKVDYDSNQSLRAKYGVTLQTTIVKIDEAGNRQTSYVAYDEPTFQSVKQALIP